VPANASELTIALQDGSGDADLYIRKGSDPTDTIYDNALEPTMAKLILC
jgi:hypothetical protein